MSDLVEFLLVAATSGRKRLTRIRCRLTGHRPVQAFTAAAAGEIWMQTGGEPITYWTKQTGGEQIPVEHFNLCRRCGERESA